MNEHQKVYCLDRGKMSIHTFFQVQIHRTDVNLYIYIYIYI